MGLGWGPKAAVRAGGAAEVEAAVGRDLGEFPGNGAVVDNGENVR